MIKIAFIDEESFNSRMQWMLEIQQDEEPSTPQAGEDPGKSALRVVNSIPDVWRGVRDKPSLTQEGFAGKNRVRVEQVQELWEALKKHYAFLGGTATFPAFEAGWEGLDPSVKPIQTNPPRPFKQKWK